MAKAVQAFKDNIIRSDELERQQQRDRAAKDCRQAAMDRYTNDFGTSVFGVMSSLLESAAAMQRMAEEVGEAARNTRTVTLTTVEGATASISTLGSVASAAEEVAASINEISQQVSQVAAAVQTAVARAAATDEKVTGLSQAADRIGDVVGLISNTAGQTNLLALNATIESARAGEAGKGFVVVAGEVKALAAPTAQATEQIESQMVTIREATAEAVAAVRDVSAAISRVDGVATVIVAAVEQQAAATREISSNVQSVNITTRATTDAIQTVLKIAEETEISSGRALDTAGEVGWTADTLRNEEASFLTAMSSGGESEDRVFAPPAVAA